MSTKSTAPKRHLLNLPPELRLSIYSHLFASTSITFRHVKGTLHKRRGSSGLAIAITATCRQLRAESLPVLWDLLTIATTISDQYASPPKGIVTRNVPVESIEMPLHRLQNLKLRIEICEVTEFHVDFVKDAAHALFQAVTADKQQLQRLDLCVELDTMMTVWDLKRMFRQLAYDIPECRAECSFYATADGLDTTVPESWRRVYDKLLDEIDG